MSNEELSDIDYHSRTGNCKDIKLSDIIVFGTHEEESKIRSKSTTNSKLKSIFCSEQEENNSFSGSTRRNESTAEQKETLSGEVPILQKKHICNECGKGFDYLSVLKRHLHSPPSEKRTFSCVTCGKTVVTIKALEDHMLLHTGEKPFECDVCPRRFTVKRALMSHRFTHTAERAFGCDMCGKRFAHRFVLKKHCLSHTGEKPFVCDICQKGFVRKTSLKCHVLSHTGRKPYICHICDSTFTWKRSYSRHMKIHVRVYPSA